MQDWIDQFYEYTDHLTSPRLFRKWAGIAAVAGALERKVWVRTLGSNLYPNLYTVLVGPPGVGKTEVTWRVRTLWQELKEHHVAASSLTAASLIDDLKDASRRIMVPNQVPSVVQFNSLQVCSNELGVLLPAYENEFMNKLTELYDCKAYSERRRTKDLHFEIKEPQLNILAATTPSFLNNVMPEGAWDQGFLSRTLLVYSGETFVKDIFVDEQKDEEGWRALQEGLSRVSKVYGKIGFSDEVKDLIRNWIFGGCEPRPDHPKLTHYLTRRPVHMIKLCMISAMSRGSEMLIEVQDFERALGWLLEVEMFIPDIFKSMAAGGDSKVIEEAWYFCYKIFMKEQKPIVEMRVVQFLQERTPAHNVMRILDVMTRAGILKGTVEPKLGKCYTPQGRKAQ